MQPNAANDTPFFIFLVKMMTSCPPVTIPDVELSRSIGKSFTIPKPAWKQVNKLTPKDRATLPHAHSTRTHTHTLIRTTNNQHWLQLQLCKLIYSTIKIFWSVQSTVGQLWLNLSKSTVAFAKMGHMSSLAVICNQYARTCYDQPLRQIWSSYLHSLRQH